MKVEIIKPNPRAELKRIAGNALAVDGKSSSIEMSLRRKKSGKGTNTQRKRSRNTPNPSITKLVEDLADKMLDRVEDEVADYLKGLFR